MRKRSLDGSTAVRIAPPSEVYDLSSEYDQAKSGEVFSDTYQRIIGRAVRRAFLLAQLKPTDDYCDADVDDACQEVSINLLQFLRKHDTRTSAEPKQKTRFLFSLAYRVARYAVAQNYSVRTCGWRARKGRAAPPRCFCVDTEILKSNPAPQNQESHDWESFVDDVELKLAPKKAAVVIALASTGNRRQASELLGTSGDALKRHVHRLKSMLRNDPSDLLGGLEPRLCPECGDRIRRDGNAKFCSPECWSLYVKREGNWSDRKTDQAAASS